MQERVLNVMLILSLNDELCSVMLLGNSAQFSLQFLNIKAYRYRM